MWQHNPETDTIDITGRRFAITKKFRNVAANPWAAVVIDDIASTDPWRPRAIVIQGPATAIKTADQPDNGTIRITPDTVISWGLDPEPSIQ
jgi:pyridoxamine 5'-phosphate oxidase family protein